MSETVEQKAARILAEGRLTVRRVEAAADGAEPLIEAECRGDTGHYALGFLPSQGRWDCSCPARIECAHLKALQLVTVRREANGREWSPPDPSTEE